MVCLMLIHQKQAKQSTFMYIFMNLFNFLSNVDVDISACIHFSRILRKLTISRGFIFASLTILPLNGIIQVICTLYTFSHTF